MYRPFDFKCYSPKGRLLDFSMETPPPFPYIDDIAEGLARIRRYAGATNYTVAEHCIAMAVNELDKSGDYRKAMGLLVHDAHEAFMGDIITPVATFLGGEAQLKLDLLKSHLQDWICEGIGWTNQLRERFIHEADAEAYAAEKRFFFSGEPCPALIRSTNAYEGFMHLHMQLSYLCMSTKVDDYARYCAAITDILDVYIKPVHTRHFEFLHNELKSRECQQETLPEQ